MQLTENKINEFQIQISKVRMVREKIIQIVRFRRKYPITSV